METSTSPLPKQSVDKHDDLHGPGLGFVDAFDPNGVLLLRFRQGHWMNAPWGVALAPDGFGKLAGSCWSDSSAAVKSASFDPDNGNFHGLLRGVMVSRLKSRDFGRSALEMERTRDQEHPVLTAGIDDSSTDCRHDYPNSKQDDDDDDGGS